MDTRTNVGYLVHRLCGERAYILERDPPNNKLLIEHIRCDVHGYPVHPGESMRCPQCDAPIKIHVNDLDIYTKARGMNGAAIIS